MFALNFSLLLLAVTLPASPASTSSFTSTPTNNPCAKISEYARSVLLSSPQATPSLVPSDVYSCQQDVPVNNSLVAAQIASLKSYISFQSTLAYLKTPPPSYDLPLVDILGGLDAIASKAVASGYQNEWQVELEVFNLIASVGDGHLTVLPYLLGAYAFVTGVNLVSISPDGIKLPEIYAYDDVKGSLQTNITISPVTEINGIDVENYLAQLRFYAPFQDFDAQYNSLLYNPSATAVQQFRPVGLFYVTTDSFYNNDTTTYTFANGTTRTSRNIAIPNTALDFDSGAELYSKYIAPSSASQAASSGSSTTPSQTAAPTNLPGYPKPFVTQVQNFVSGYFLDETGQTDVAVLNIRSFDVATEPEAASFQNTIREFIASCKDNGKTRLLIDVRGNGGGDLILTVDTFKQLFPSLTPYTGMRWPLTDIANLLGPQISKLNDSIITQHPGLLAAYNSLYNANDAQNSLNGQPFTSWEALSNPVVHALDANFTKVVSWNFNNRALDDSLGITPAGHLNNTNIPQTQAFDSENITIFTDGACSSACAMFTNLMLNQGHAKSIVAGGRPLNQPMAIVGGTQGGEEQSWDVMSDYAKAAVAIANETNTLTPEYDILKPLLEETPLRLWGGLAGQKVNIRDNIAQGDASMTPLQFTKRYADCRIFYVKEDLFDVQSTWVRVLNGVKRQGQGLCVNGSVAAWDMVNGVAGGNRSATGTGVGNGSTNTEAGNAFTGAGMALVRDAWVLVVGLWLSALIL